MDRRPIIFLDSGLGGFPYGYFFHSRNAREPLICVGDRANFPYGVKSRETLVGILDSVTDRFVPEYNPKLLALVCNTASVTGLDFLRKKYADLPIVGTVPAIKPAVTASRNRRVGVIGSERTVEDPLIRELADRYGSDCEIMTIAAPELIEFVQLHYGSSTPRERLDTVKKYVDRFRSSGVDSIVLGCTHFLLLQDEFRAAAGEGIGIFDSMEGVCRRVEFILNQDGGKLRAGADSAATVPFAEITGEAPLEPYWEQLSLRFGFTLERHS